MDTDPNHHDQNTTQQITCANDVPSALDELWNAFLDCSAETLKKYRTVIDELLLKNATSISSTIPRNSHPLFRKPKRADPSKGWQKTTELKNEFVPPPNATLLARPKKVTYKMFQALKREISSIIVFIWKTETGK